MARKAAFGPEPLFSTQALFAPISTSLALHSYAPLVSIMVSLLFPFADTVALYNLALIGAVFLNLTCAYAAAWMLTRDRLASFFAAVYVSCPCWPTRGFPAAPSSLSR